MAILESGSTCLRTSRAGYLHEIGAGPKPREVIPLARYRHPQNRPNLVPVAHLSRRVSRPLQPFREIHQLDLVLDAHVRNRHPYDVMPLRDAGDPLVTADCSETVRHGLVERGRRDLNGMRDAVHVLDRDAARADWHRATTIALGSEEARKVPSRWPPSAAQTARTVFPYAAFAKIHNF
jgi:hypothetical protein